MGDEGRGRVLLIVVVVAVLVVVLAMLTAVVEVKFAVFLVVLNVVFCEIASCSRGSPCRANGRRMAGR